MKKWKYYPAAWFPAQRSFMWGDFVGVLYSIEVVLPLSLSPSLELMNLYNKLKFETKGITLISENITIESNWNCRKIKFRKSIAEGDVHLCAKHNLVKNFLTIRNEQTCAVPLEQYYLMVLRNFEDIILKIIGKEGILACSGYLEVAAETPELQKQWIFKRWVFWRALKLNLLEFGFCFMFIQSIKIVKVCFNLNLIWFDFLLTRFTLSPSRNSIRGGWQNDILEYEFYN